MKKKMRHDFLASYHLSLQNIAINLNSMLKKNEGGLRQEPLVLGIGPKKKKSYNTIQTADLSS